MGAPFLDRPSVSPAERHVSSAAVICKELANWTGGVPILAAAMLLTIHREFADGHVLTWEDVERVAAGVADEFREVLAELWDECPTELQTIVSELLGGEKAASLFETAAARELVNRGLVRKSSNRLRIGCRLVADYARPMASEVSDLNRLFGEQSRFQRNFRRMLELRLAQISGCDADLMFLVSRAILDLDRPEASLLWARDVADQALAIVWNAEIPTRAIPDDWLKKFAQPVQEKLKDGRVPTRRGLQCWLLRLLTGTEDNQRLTRFISKPTGLLIDYIQSVGDFRHHLEGAAIPWNFAASFCFSAIELCELLTSDLGRREAAPMA
jgi:hypothetical protein